MQPILDAMQDNILALKHNLNANAIGALKGELTNIQRDVTLLVRDECVYWSVWRVYWKNEILESRKMNELSLLYFDIDGGRAKPFAGTLQSIEFDDVRFPVKSSRSKSQTPFGQVPTLTVNGQVITQTNAICDCWTASWIVPDELMEALLVDDVGCRRRYDREW